MAQAVVQEIDHGRVVGDLEQQVLEAVQAAPAEHFPLCMRCDLALVLAVGVTQDAVPEENHLLFQLALGIDHPKCYVFGYTPDVVVPFNEGTLG